MTSVKGLRRDYSSSEYAASREGEGERDRGREDTFAFIDLWSVQRLADIEQGGWHSRKFCEVCNRGLACLRHR